MGITQNIHSTALVRIIDWILPLLQSRPEDTVEDTTTTEDHTQIIEDGEDTSVMSPPTAVGFALIIGQLDVKSYQE